MQNNSLAVIPLEWVEILSPGLPTTWRAESPVGWYQIELHPSMEHVGKYWLTQQQTAYEKLLRFRVLAEAQAAAQADFEQRIRSALTTQAGLQAQAVSEAMKLLREVRDKGLIYWEPNTERGHAQKADMLARVEAALSAEPAPGEAGERS